MSSAPQCQLVDRKQPYGPDAFPLPEYDLSVSDKQAELVLGGGCFWCTEAVYKQLRGVKSVVSGYAGGSATTANYSAVCGGNSGHAEVLKIVFDSEQVSYGQLLKVFFAVAHDPTQLNRQGNDVGTQYRSVVFYQNSAEQDVVERYIQLLNAAGVYSQAIATTVEPLEAFYKAEESHQNYAQLNPHQPYIQAVSTPKVDKLRHYFADEIQD